MSLEAAVITMFDVRMDAEPRADASRGASAGYAKACRTINLNSTLPRAGSRRGACCGDAWSNKLSSLDSKLVMFAVVNLSF